MSFIRTLIIILVFTVCSSFMLQFDSSNRYLLKECTYCYLSFTDSIPETTMKNLSMIGYVNNYGVQGETKDIRLYGAILRALRFKNITDKVEDKYGLPRNLILAMVIQETGGADVLPNGRNDGGLGLCHMQASVASEFGLKTYKDCNELVCVVHGVQIKELITAEKYDRKKLIKYDDRFHPIKNLDAVGRMLKYYSLGTQVKDTEIKTAIYRYAGKYNYSKYYANVIYFQNKLNDDDVVDAVRKAFNEKNPNLMIGGEAGDFDRYIKTHQDQNVNYGLLEYNE